MGVDSGQKSSRIVLEQAKSAESLEILRQERLSIPRPNLPTTPCRNKGVLDSIGRGSCSSHHRVVPLAEHQE